MRTDKAIEELLVRMTRPRSALEIAWHLADTTPTEAGRMLAIMVADGRVIAIDDPDRGRLYFWNPERRLAASASLIASGYRVDTLRGLAARCIGAIVAALVFTLIVRGYLT